MNVGQLLAVIEELGHLDPSDEAHVYCEDASEYAPLNHAEIKITRDFESGKKTFSLRLGV